MTRPCAEPINAYEAAAIVLSAALLLAACGSTKPPADPAAAPDAILATTVSRATYGDGWPFTVASGILSCHPGQAVVFETSDGTVYALNGVATADPQFHDLEPIWLDDPSGVAPKLSIGPLIETGLALCR
jgi:hypothetical protein